jgi:hypothetical protein
VRLVISSASRSALSVKKRFDVWMSVEACFAIAAASLGCQ